MARTLPPRVRLAGYELNLKAGELRGGGQTVRLAEKPFRVLLILVEGGGELVTREEIQKKLWPGDTVVDFEHGINTAIKVLRRALGDSVEDPKYIETIPRRGYRLMVPVEGVDSRSGDGLGVEAVFSGQDETTARIELESAALIGKTVSHYRVLHVIGGGGMGVVYKAEDLKLGRAVAVKFLPAEVGSDPRALERFQREARTASSLNHPNICTIYEIEEHEGQPFIVMELLEGRTLRDRLAAAASATELISPDQILNIGLQISEGLEAAHEKGIIHRDIKPANIFITNKGVTKILDFGLAKLLQPSGEPAIAAETDGEPGPPTPAVAGSEALNLSRSGEAMGTAGYMSPEQVRGENVDARTDLFSFGLVLYEMATGQGAFSGETAAAVHNAILTQTPAPAHELNPGISRESEEIINRAIEKDRELRYQSAAEMRADLESVGRQGERDAPSRWKLWTMAAFFVVALTAGSFYWYSRRTTKLTKEDTVVLADFTNSTGDAVFDDALKMALTVSLRQSPMLNLLSDSKINGTLKVMNRSPSERLTYEVAKELCLRTNSRALLASSIADIGNLYRLELKVVDCHTGTTLASTQAEAENRNEIVRRLGEAGTRLRGQLGESRTTLEKFNRPLDEAMSSSPEALEAFSRAAKAQLQSPAAALPYLRRAIELDPNFTAAYANLGVTFHNLGELSLASKNLKKAYELRDRMTERHRLAIQAHYYSDVTGELDKVIQTYNETERSYPGFWANHNNLGEAFLKIGQYEKSAVEEHESLRLMPDTAQSYNNLMLDYIALGQLDESKALFEKARARNVDGSDLRATRYMLAFLQADNATMQEELSWAKGKPKIEDVLLSYQSDTEGYYGRLNKAREFSNRAVESARQSNSPETMASWRAKEALIEAETGNTTRALQCVADVLAHSPGQDAEVMAAVALAHAGEVNRAQQVVDKLALEFPLDTLIQGYWLPTVRAAIELNRGNPERAVEEVQVAATYELGSPSNSRSGRIGSMYPVYVRGLAHLKSGQGQRAAAEFQKMLDHPGIVGNFVIGALAHLQLARAQAMMGDKAAARRSYQDFLTLWKDADPDIPIYQQAKAEYARLK